MFEKAHLELSPSAGLGEWAEGRRWARGLEGQSQKETSEGPLGVLLLVAVVVEGHGIAEESKVGQAAGYRKTVVGSTEDLLSLVVKQRLVVMEEVAFVGCIEVEEAVLYLGGTWSGEMLAL